MASTGFSCAVELLLYYACFYTLQAVFDIIQSRLEIRTKAHIHQKPIKHRGSQRRLYYSSQSDSSDEELEPDLADLPLHERLPRMPQIRTDGKIKYTNLADELAACGEDDLDFQAASYGNTATRLEKPKDSF